MKKILCFLVVAAVVAQILARPGDKGEKKPVDDAKKVADKAEHKAKDAKKKLEKGADDVKDAVKDDADDFEDEAKKVVPHRPKHHKGGLFKGAAHVGERVIDSWAGLADDIFGI